MKSWFFRAASRSSESTTARLIASAPRLPPVISSVNGARCSLAGAAKNSLRTGHPVTTAFAPNCVAALLTRHRDPRRKPGENAVGESRLDVRLEHHTRNPIHHRNENHRAGSVSADSQRHVEPVPAQRFLPSPTAPPEASPRCGRISPRQCLSGLAMWIVSSGSPACGTSRASIPRSVPTNTTPLSPSLPRRSHSFATASAGKTCPPVPPPAINKFFASALTSVCVLADVQQHSGCQKHSEQARSSVADERQRNPLRRHQAEHYAQIDQRLAHDHRRDPDSKQTPESVRRFHRGHESAPAVYREQRQHDARQEFDSSQITQKMKSVCAWAGKTTSGGSP